MHYYDVRRLPFDDSDHRGAVPASPLVSASARRGDGLTAVPAASCASHAASYVSRVRSCVTGAWGRCLCRFCTGWQFGSRTCSCPARRRVVIRTEITLQSHGSFTPAKQDRHVNQMQKQSRRRSSR